MLSNVFTKTVRDRWKAMAIGSVTLAALFFFGMSVYRDIDISLYTSLPDVLLSLMNIPKDADVGSLAYGAIYTSYGALTLAALALVMGAGSIAGEERNGTLGLLLGNPKSRTQVLLSKAGSMVLLTVLGALVLWGAGRLAPVVLDVSVAGIDVEALLVFMAVNALFYGFLAMAIGAWTGKRGLASGATAGIMVISFVAVGLLPLVEGPRMSREHFRGTTSSAAIHTSTASTGVISPCFPSAVPFWSEPRSSVSTAGTSRVRPRACPSSTDCAPTASLGKRPTGLPARLGYHGSGSRLPPTTKVCCSSPRRSCSS